MRTTRATSAATTKAPSAPVAVRASHVEQRIYLALNRERLVEVLASLGDQDWRSELGSATDPFRWPDAAEAARPSDMVVLVANLAGELQLVAAANEPARRAVREALDAAGVESRVVLQPTWWA